VIVNAEDQTDVGNKNVKIVMLQIFRSKNQLMDFALMIANVKELKIVGNILAKIVMLQVTKELEKVLPANMIAAALVLSDALMMFVQIAMPRITKELNQDNASMIVNALEIINASEEAAKIVTMPNIPVLHKVLNADMIAIAKVYSPVLIINAQIVTVQIIKELL
jgi:hypothetical protein